MKVLGMAAVLAVLTAGPALAKPADPALSAELERLTQAFSDAGLNDDRAAFERLADDDLIMTNEGGDIATKADLLQGANGQPRPGQTLTVTDFAARVQGDVATVTFVDVLKQTVAGQALEYRFRSTETWLRKPPGWKMISSQTLSLLDDPKAVALPAAELQAYVGRYRLTEGLEVEVALKDGGLVATQTGAAPVAWKAEARDVFFTPGQPRGRKVFLRDAAGRITGYASRREGRDLILARIG